MFWACQGARLTNRGLRVYWYTTANMGVNKSVPKQQCILKKRRTHTKVDHCRFLFRFFAD